MSSDSDTKESLLNKKRRASSDLPLSKNSNNAEDAELAKYRHLADTAKQFIINVFEKQGGKNGPYRCEEGVEFWNDLDSEWQLDRDVAFAAASNTRVKLEELPSVWAQDREFLLGVVSKNSSMWRDLPQHYQSDIEFARNISLFYDYGLFKVVVDRFPVLLDDRDTWFKVIESFDDMSLCTIFTRKARPWVFLSREIMLKACSKDGDMIQFVDESLLRDRDFVEDALIRNPLALDSLPQAAQILFTDLVGTTLSEYFAGSNEDPDEYQPLSDALAPALWHNRSFVKAWIQAGGGFLPDKFPNSFRDDEEIFMWIARRSSYSQCRESFDEASLALRKNKQFMLRAIQVNVSAFLSASRALKKDYDLALLFFSREGIIHNCTRRSMSNSTVGHLFRQKLMAKLGSYQTFFDTFLCAISSADRSCSLTMLNQGNDTALGFKSRIADYAGVPRGSELRLLRQARENIEADARRAQEIMEADA